MQYIKGAYGIVNHDELGEGALMIYDGGLELRNGKEYYFENDKRPDYDGYLLQCTLDGQGAFEKNGSIHKMKKGTAFLVHFPDSSRYWFDGESDNWEFAYIHFNGDGIREIYNKIININNGIIVLGENNRVVPMLLKLHRRMISGEIPEKYEGGIFIYEMMCELLRESEGNLRTSEIRSETVRKAVAIMEKKYAGIKGIEEIADCVGVSWEHFSRTFKKEMGVKPIEYLSEIRIHKAINLLLNTEDKIESIAQNCGFTNGNYFSKVFRKKMGKTPGNYRRQTKIYT